MSDMNWNDMEDQQFDRALQSCLNEAPQPDIVQHVLPWKRAIDQILAGVTLRVVVLQFWHLNYILPTIGTLLLFLGFRALRWENRWLAFGWVISGVQLIQVMVSLILNTTIYSLAAGGSGSLVHLILLQSVSIALQLLQLLALWRGLLAVQKKAGVTPYAPSAFALLCWYAALVALALTNGGGWLLLGMLGVYVCLVVSIYRIEKEVDLAGYALRPVPVHLSDQTVAIALGVVLLLGSVCGYLFFRRYPMQWQPVEQSQSEKATQIRGQLQALGAPDYVLADLTEEELLSCEGGLRVYVDVKTHPMQQSSWTSIRAASPFQSKPSVQPTAQEPQDLRVTGVAIQLPGDRERWKLIQHFEWLVPPDFCGTESIHLLPTYYVALSTAWSKAGEFSGRLLYHQGEQVFAADYYHFGPASSALHRSFQDNSPPDELSAVFSLPRDGQRQRGYFCYTVQAMSEGYIVDSWFGYTHQTHWLQYPVQTADQRHAFGSWFDHTFQACYDSLQFFPAQMP